MIHGRGGFSQQDPRRTPPARLPSPLGFYLSSVVSALEQNLDRQYGTAVDVAADDGGDFAAATPPSWVDAGPASWFALAWPDPPAPGLVLPYARRPLVVDGSYRAAPVAPSTSSRPACFPTWSERVVAEMPVGAESPGVQIAHAVEHCATPKRAVRECLIDHGVVPPPGLPPPLEPCERAPTMRTAPKRAPIARTRRNSAQ